MKKNLIYLLLLLSVSGSYQCTKVTEGVRVNNNEEVLTGKLVIKELCGHYVVEVVSGNIDTSKVVKEWRDEKRNATYQKAFTVSNVCDFSVANLSEGDEFLFTINESPDPAAYCIVCLAYYPTPLKRNAIAITSILKSSGF